jgi:hypothetical protein
MRDNIWLDRKLSEIWEKHFSDVPRGNEVYIKFGRDARTRLGSIRKIGKSSTLITITGYFKDERVPDFMVEATIAHELCHYAHGFFSPLPRLSRHPHQGGLVDNELKTRGFSGQLKAQKKWLKEVWPKIIGMRVRRRRIMRKKQYSGVNILKFLISN